MKLDKINRDWSYSIGMCARVVVTRRGNLSGRIATERDRTIDSSTEGCDCLNGVLWIASRGSNDPSCPISLRKFKTSSPISLHVHIGGKRLFPHQVLTLNATEREQQETVLNRLKIQSL
jgi:hypothetical protein